MEDIHLADIWRDSLKAQGWSDRASCQYVHALSTSTLQLYDRYINKFRLYCLDKNVAFPPTMPCTDVVSDFMCGIADSSQRPESQLKVVTASIGALYSAYGLDSPITSSIRHLNIALVKSGTHVPARRTPSMSVVPFMKLFESWDANCNLSMKYLRLKCIVLISLFFMSRPSDLAPKGVTFDPETGTTSPLVLSRDNVSFHDDDSVTIAFFGIKNDTSRTGFEVRIPQTDNEKSDPVRCLQCYIDKTEHLCKGVRPLFLSLRSPYTALSANGIRTVLNEAIRLAGLDKQGYTAKSFRPTGANAAIAAGVTPECAMQIGRWKTKEVFFNHYVYPMAPPSYTRDCAEYSGTHY